MNESIWIYAVFVAIDAILGAGFFLFLANKLTAKCRRLSRFLVLLAFPSCVVTVLCAAMVVTGHAAYEPYLYFFSCVPTFCGLMLLFGYLSRSQKWGSHVRTTVDH